jgi:hypothetical protein
MPVPLLTVNPYAYAETEKTARVVSFMVGGWTSGEIALLEPWYLRLSLSSNETMLDGDQLHPTLKGCSR